MKLSKRLLFALLLAGCTSTGDLTPQAQKIVGAACKIDAATQPVAVTVAPVAVQTTDNLLVHPIVVQACAAVGGTPVAATVTPAVTPVATSK